MVELTEYEKDLLNGIYGADKQKAMELIVEYAIALGAKKLVEVHSITGGLGASKDIMADLKSNDYDMEKIYCEYKLNSSEKVSVNKVCVPTTTLINLLDFDKIDELEISEDIVKYCKIADNFSKKIGMQNLYTCAPYLSGFIPMYGEHLAWMESSAVIMANSVFGARTNTESLESTGAASIVGRIPYWGLHIKENRYADYHIKVEVDIDSEFEYGLLGYYIGETVQEKIPVITGITKRPTLEKLKHFGAALAASGGVELYHIVGVTPEANTFEEAVGTKKNQKTIVITKKELLETYKKINMHQNKSKIDFVIFGCPHASLEQIKEIVELIENKKINKNVKMWILTPYSVKSLCDRQGYTKIIEDFGALLLSDICPAIAGLVPKNTKNIVTNSIKQAHYISNLLKCNCYYSSLEKCISAAITGEWNGDLNDIEI